MHVDPGSDKCLALHVGEQIEERRPEAFDIGDNDWFGMPAKLRPGQLFNQFLKCADAARQRDEGVRALKHQPFADVHILNHDQFVNVFQHFFLGAEELRNDARHFTASAEHSFGDFAHQPQATAAVDEADVCVREGLAKRLGGNGVGGAQTCAGAAIDANAFDAGFDKGGCCMGRNGRSFLEHFRLSYWPGISDRHIVVVADERAR